DHPAARILVLTTFDGDEDIYTALRAGAKGYLLKGVPVEELLRAIRSIHAGRKHIPPEVAQKLAERVFSDQLTDRETEVLRLIVGGLANAEIAERLFVTEGTVKFHITRIFSKLGVEDRTQAAILAIKRGIARL
ncbi:MAG TPA: response regulator transcription factor, partial [Acidobacteriota bacterium]|nr:response regulator transcription factor [Acidobacteriota bacterium]